MNNLEAKNEGNFSEILILIENLKKTVFSKFEKVEEEHRNFKEENGKIRNDILNVKQDLDRINKVTSTNSKHIEELYLLIEELRKEVKSEDEKYDKAIKDQLAKMQDLLSQDKNDRFYGKNTKR